MRPVDIVLALMAESNTEKQKHIIRHAWKNDITNFFVGLEIATNPTYDFGIDEVPLIDDDDDGYEGDFSFDEFYDLANRMLSRELVDRKAKEALYEAASVANITEWNQWYRRILLHTLPKVLPMNIIKETLMELTSE